MDGFPFAVERPILSPDLAHHFASVPGVALDELDAFALLNRVDTKFVLTEAQAAHVFARVGNRYRVLEVNGLRSGHYRTLYFDTPSLDMYRAHHNGVRDRFKVRQRAYVDSGTTFFEIKRKTNRERTVKQRIVIPALNSRIAGSMGDFLRTHTPYDPELLHPGVSNEFLRVSLVGVDDIERLTLDLCLTVALDGARLSLPGLVVAEVKQPKFSTNSPFVQQVRALRIEPMAFSKYCHAIAALRSDARRNRFKERMFHLDRLMARGGSS